MQKEIYLTIEGEPGQEIQIRWRGERENEENPSPVILTARLGSDGCLTVLVPRGYLVIRYTEREGLISKRLDLIEGDSITLSFDNLQTDADTSADSQSGKNADDDESVKEPADHDFIAQIEEVFAETGEPAAAADNLRAAALPWRAARSLTTLKDQVNRRAPNRNKASDGTIGDTRHCRSSSSTSDHCPRIIDSGIGVVTAIDITHDPARNCDANRIAESIRASRDLRVKYIIWNRRIANSSPINGAAAWTWRPYSGSNPHTRHIHISVKSSSAHYDSTDAWEI